MLAWALTLAAGAPGARAADRTVENAFFLQADGLRAWRASPNPWTAAAWEAVGAPIDPRPAGSARLSNSAVAGEDAIASLEQCVPNVVAGGAYQLAVQWQAPAGQPLQEGGGFGYVSLRFFSGEACQPLTDLGTVLPPQPTAFGPAGSGGWGWLSQGLSTAPAAARSLSVTLAHGRHSGQPVGVSAVVFDAVLLLGPSPFLKGSFDASGEVSLLLRNVVTGEHRAWLMRDETRFSEGSIAPAVPLAWQAAGVDDFDGDGLNDLLLWHPANGWLDFWRLDGLTRLGAAIPITPADPGPAWRPSATADFNHDGHPDIVLRNPVSQQIVIWTLDGTLHVGSITPSPSQAVDGNWEIVGAVGLNGDANTDLLWYNSHSGRIVYWLMDATVTRITGAFANPMAAGDSNWKVLATGDYGIGPNLPGPGLAGTFDLVWRNATSGRLVIWFMDRAGNRTGGSFAAPPDLPAPAGDWTVVGPR